MDAPVPQRREGSTDLICEYLQYALCMIMCQRKFYSEYDFAETARFGLALPVPSHPELISYLQGLMRYLYKWIKNTEISELQFTILDTMRTPVEKYVFAFVVLDYRASQDETYRTIQNSLHALMAIIAQRPVLAGEHDFIIQIKEHAGNTIPVEWSISNEKMVPNADVLTAPTAKMLEAGIQIKVYTFPTYSNLMT